MELTDFLWSIAALLGSMVVFVFIVLLILKASIIVKAVKAILEIPLFWKYFFEELRKERSK